MISEMNFFERIVYILQNYGISYLKGAGTTLLIALVSTAIGCVIGFAVGIVQTIPVDKKRDGIGKRFLLGLVKVILKAYVEIFRGTPMIVQAVFIYFGLSQMCNIQLGMWQAAFLVVSINTGAYMAETVRGGINSIDVGQIEGAKALGMGYVPMMIYIILPQTFKIIAPQIGNTFVANIKDTSVLNVIAVTELFYITKVAAGTYFRMFEAYTITALIYLTLTLLFNGLLKLIEKYMAGKESYEVLNPAAAK